MSSGARKTRKRPEIVREGSGNVFADLGIADSAEALAKAEIATRIALTIQRKGLTQARAAALLGIDQADVSDLVRGKLKGFSTDRLLRFLLALGRDVRIVIGRTLHSGKHGRLSVLDNTPVGTGPRGK